MQPSPESEVLITQLAQAESASQSPGPLFHASSIGATVYFAYEQLRNVAEYRERHLLLRSAVERYLRRHVKWEHVGALAADLITDLTQAGYLRNDTIAQSVVGAIDQLVMEYSRLYVTLRQPHRVPAKDATSWVNQITSVQIEDLLTPNPKSRIFMAFALEHYRQAIVPESDMKATGEDYDVALLCAVQRSIFKSDLATTRYYCYAHRAATAEHRTVENFILLNRSVDRLYVAPLTNRLSRLINRHGAPMRALRELVMQTSQPAELLRRPTETISRIKTLCQKQYGHIQKELNANIGKAILFILITKVLLGIAVEVPYDIVRLGAIMWLPLLINIAFPPLYMASIGFTVSTPGRRNTEEIAALARRILYTEEGQTPVGYRFKRRITSASLNQLFMVVYVLGFGVSIGLVIWLLHLLQFNIVNGIIFFIFFSAVSFLGFRLRQTVREYELVDRRTHLWQAVVDFFLTPFIRVGHWLSDRYAKVNVVALFLDIAIEMPLKTTLRLVRQWVWFMRDKQEEL